MTAARQQRKSRRIPGILLGIVLSGGILAPFTSKADDIGPIVVNPHTGLAISGIDPVAYFTDGKPVFGHPDLEFSYAGTVWRFSNAGNRAAFIEHPEIYMPQFGGYDPVAVARGRSVAGYPLYWAIVAQRLYLFYDGAARAAFLADTGRILATAMRRWPAVARTLGR